MIETKNLTKKFDSFTAVDSLDLRIETGEFFGLLGPNGAGKTTTINAIIDLLEDISLSVLDLEDETATLGEYVEELDHDLGALEEECYDCDCCEDDDCDCCGDDFEELECPACGETIYLDPDAIPDDHLIVCPSCNREIEVKEEEAE